MNISILDCGSLQIQREYHDNHFASVNPILIFSSCGSDRFGYEYNNGSSDSSTTENAGPPHYVVHVRSV